MRDVTVIGFEEDTRFVDHIAVKTGVGVLPNSSKGREDIKKAVDIYLSEERPNFEVASVLMGHHSDVYGE